MRGERMGCHHTGNLEAIACLQKAHTTTAGAAETGMMLMLRPFEGGLPISGDTSAKDDLSKIPFKGLQS